MPRSLSILATGYTISPPTLRSSRAPSTITTEASSIAFLRRVAGPTISQPKLARKSSRIMETSASSSTTRIRRPCNGEPVEGRSLMSGAPGVKMKPQGEADPVGAKVEMNVGFQLAPQPALDQPRSEAARARLFNGGAAGFGPAKLQNRPVIGGGGVPGDFHPARRHGQRAKFRGIGRQLVKRQANDERLLRIKLNVLAGNDGPLVFVALIRR